MIYIVLCIDRSSSRGNRRISQTLRRASARLALNRQGGRAPDRCSSGARATPVQQASKPAVCPYPCLGTGGGGERGWPRWACDTLSARTLHTALRATAPTSQVAPVLESAPTRFEATTCEVRQRDSVGHKTCAPTRRRPKSTLVESSDRTHSSHVRFDELVAQGTRYGTFNNPWYAQRRRDAQSAHDCAKAPGLIDEHARQMHIE